MKKDEKPDRAAADIPDKNGKAKRLGFMRGCASVPEDFDEMECEEIARLFDGQSLAKA